MKRSSFAETRSDFEWDYDSRNLPGNASAANNESAGDPFSNDLGQVNYDRRELRRRLSLDSDQEDELNSQFAMRVKRSNLRERLQQRMNLQICFVDNDADDDDDEDSNCHINDHQDISIDEHNIDSLGNISNSSVKGSHDSSNCTQSSHQQSTTQKSISSQIASQPNLNGLSDSSNKQIKQQETQVTTHTTSSLLDSSNKLLSKFKPLFTFAPFSNLNFSQVKNSSLNSGTGVGDLHFDTFEEYHAHIHNEAKKALKSAKEMAQMQMQLEKDQSKANKILGINVDKTSTNREDLKKDSTQLSKMSISQLKHLIDQINAKATQLNVTLVKLLEERDELNMEQDSLLIDIEDLTRFFLSQNR